MKYMGSKNRHALDILKIILADRKPGQWYVEPFVGGFNVIDKVTGNRIGNDVNPYLTDMFIAIRNGWIPPDIITNDQYNTIKNDKDSFANYIVGFVGFGCSYSGKFFGGYARGNTDKGLERNYCLESKTNLLKQAAKLKGVLITNQNYYDMDIPDNSIIYCDPPYANTTGYGGKFDTNRFWEWVREMSSKGHSMFISEYTAPDDFECVWSKSVNNTLVKNTGSKKGVEKLFIPKHM